MGRYQTAAPHFKEWAEGLSQSADPLSHVAVDEILFIEDTETETKSDNKRYMELKKIPEFVEDALGAHFGVARKAYAVIIYRLNCSNLDNETMIAHLAEQLLKIPDEGRSLNQPDVRTFAVLAAALGYNWKQRLQEKLPNLLTERPKGWPARLVQMTMDSMPKQDGAGPVPDDNDAPDEPGQTRNDDGRQPAEPFVKKDNVVNFPGAQPLASTGTDNPTPE